jgi:hypothetical protein
MKVVPTGRLTYEVSSRTGQIPRTVDIGMIRQGGICNGRCDCEDFRNNIAPKIRELRREGLFKPSDAFRCAHIRAARNFAFDEMLDKLVVQIRKQFNDYPERDDEV